MTFYNYLITIILLLVLITTDSASAGISHHNMFYTSKSVFDMQKISKNRTLDSPYQVNKANRE